MIRLIALIALGSLPAVACGQVPSLDDLIPPAEQRLIGITKLTARQRELLRVAILRNMTLAVKATAAKDERGARPVARPRYVASGRHWIKEMIGRGEMFLLEDGSLWEVDRLDRLDSSLWLKLENITVIEAKDGAPGFDYVLVNTDSGEKVHAKYLGRK